MSGPSLLLAEALAGAWRVDSGGLDLSAEQLGRLAPLLIYGGEAALVWRRVRGGKSRTCSAGRWLRDEHRHNTTAAFLAEQQIQLLVSHMRAGGIEPILIKGWAAARHYAEPGLRPYSDLDLCVRPEQHSAAAARLQLFPPAALPVDLHRGIPDLPDRSWDELYRRSRPARLGNVDVRVLGPEDHLRLTGLHWVRHGGWRMLWLCDIAAALEAGSDDFDWDYCLNGPRQRSEWLRGVIGLARRLLGARTPPGFSSELPAWLPRTVLWLWGAGHLRHSCRYYLYHPVEAVAGLRCDWLNPIKAAFRLGLGPGHRWPLPLVQLGEWLRRARELPARFRGYGRYWSS